MAILVVDYGNGKLLTWDTTEEKIKELCGLLLSKASTWNECWQKILGEDYAATNSLDDDVKELAHSRENNVDVYLDLEDLEATLQAWHSDTLMISAYAAQSKLIEERCGKRASVEANYGHSVEDWEDGTLEISTKVYRGRGRGPGATYYLVTTISPTGEFIHNWRD